VSNGPWSVHVEVFNLDGKLARVSVIQVTVEGVLLRPTVRCNTGKATCVRRKSPPLALCLVGWLDGLYYNIHEASINYVV
jgi:hypothetical protein